MCLRRIEMSKKEEKIQNRIMVVVLGKTKYILLYVFKLCAKFLIWKLK